jgi:hypothetical protein
VAEQEDGEAAEMNLFTETAGNLRNNIEGK